MAETLYLKLRHRIQVKPNHIVKIKDIAQLLGENEQLVHQMNETIIHPITKSDRNIVVIDIIRVIRKLQAQADNLDVQTIGPSQSIVQVVYGSKKMAPLYIFFISLLLFIGAALAIMNFHEDVSMGDVHHKLYKLITGQSIEKPLLLQVPYSIGLGVGMILFFNHLFQKRINEEPSPLEVEMFNYQQDLDQFIIMNENKENVKKIEPD